MICGEASASGRRGVALGRDMRLAIRTGGGPDGRSSLLGFEALGLLAADGLASGDEPGLIRPVSYTHLTLPTNREV